MDICFTGTDYEKLNKLQSIYKTAKLYILYSEEIDPTSSSNLQIMKELRDAFDHLMAIVHLKAQSFDYSKGSNDKEEYVSENFEKAIGHVYISAFDALDGAVISLEELIALELNMYPSEVIKEVMPEYWDIKRRIHEVVDNVASHRSNKDLGSNSDDALNKYIADLDELDRIYKKILESGSLFDECIKQRKKKSLKKCMVTILIGVAIGLLIAFFSPFL